MEWSPELQCLLMLLVPGNPEDVESVGQPTGCSSICPHTSYVFVVAIVIVIKLGVRASCRLACAWFLKIDHVQIVGMRVRVCVSAPEAINN